MKLPAHMSIKLTCYVRSDSEGNGADISVGGCVDTDFLAQLSDLDGFTKAACSALDAALGSTDARPMTKDEVEKYQREKREDEREAGRVVESARVEDLED